MFSISPASELEVHWKPMLYVSAVSGSSSGLPLSTPAVAVVGNT